MLNRPPKRRGEKRPWCQAVPSTRVLTLQHSTYFGSCIGQLANQCSNYLSLSAAAHSPLYCHSPPFPVIRSPFSVLRIYSCSVTLPYITFYITLRYVTLLYFTYSLFFVHCYASAYSVCTNSLSLCYSAALYCTFINYYSASAPTLHIIQLPTYIENYRLFHLSPLAIQPPPPHPRSTKSLLSSAHPPSTCVLFNSAKSNSRFSHCHKKEALAFDGFSASPSPATA